jgi:hypothetical protein
MRALSLTAALLLTLAGASPAQNGGYKYSTIDFPGATSTTPLAINALGQIAGTYDGQGLYAKAFVYSGGVYTTIDVPGGPYISATSVSIGDSGMVYGGYYASTFLPPPYLNVFQYNLNNGTLTTSTISPQIPGATIGFSLIQAIGPTGDVLGLATGEPQFYYFLYANGKTTVLGNTAAVSYFSPSGANAEGVVVGSSNTNPIGGYLYSNGTYTLLPAGFDPTGIGPSNQLIGSYLTNYLSRDVIFQDGAIIMPGDDPLAVPGSTTFSGINASGQIVGSYTDSLGIVHGFLATPTAPPATEKTRINIDSPNSNVQASGTYTASGWAVDNTVSINAVSIQVDGQFVGLATYGNTRPDVCAVYSTSASCPNVGWTYSLNTSALADGLHTFAAIAVSNNGKHAVASTSFTVGNATANTASAILMNIDVPNGNSSKLSGSTTLAGWAFDTAEQLEGVQVAIDPDQSLLNNNYYYYGSYAVLGGPRPDVCAALNNPANCANSGWSYTLDTTQLSNGAHILAVSAVAPSGNRRTLTAAFSVSNNGPLRVNIDVPAAKSAAVSGSIVIGGWAEDDNVAMGSVTYSVDGANVYYGGGLAGYAYFGGFRTDVCAVYPKSPDCPNVGWSARLDTTQLANGTHTLTVTATSQAYLPAGSIFYTDDTLTTAPVTFTVNNTISSQSTHVNIDQPTPSQVLWHQATISGWAVDDNTAINSIEIAVDGQAVGSTAPSISRPDVCAVYPNRPGCPNVGWSTTLDTDLLTNGMHTLTVTAISEVDAEATASTTFNVTNGNGADTTKVNIDAPNPQSGNLSGQQTFAGWSINDDAAATVTIFIDGVTQPAPSNVARPDVCNVYPDAVNCPNVGWSIPIDTTLLANGAHTLEVLAASSTNPAATASSSTMFTVANSAAASPIKMSIDIPGSTSISGVANFAGWAAGDTDTIADVQISVDNVVLGDAYYGNNRPDVCKAFPTLIGCPAANVGWSFAIDTTLLANGPHTVEATATTAGGVNLTTSKAFTLAN